jgi:hypothetical protein
MLRAMPNIMGAPDGLHTHVVDADGISALDADAWDRLSAAARVKIHFMLVSMSWRD